MEFKSLKNIESSFRQIRMIALVFLVLCTLVAGYSIWWKIHSPLPPSVHFKVIPQIHSKVTP